MQTDTVNINNNQLNTKTSGKEYRIKRLKIECLIKINTNSKRKNTKPATKTKLIIISHQTNNSKYQGCKKFTGNS